LILWLTQQDLPFFFPPSQCDCKFLFIEIISVQAKIVISCISFKFGAILDWYYLDNHNYNHMKLLIITQFNIMQEGIQGFLLCVAAI